LREFAISLILSCHKKKKKKKKIETTALLASPIYIGQAQGEEKKGYKKRSQN